MCGIAGYFGKGDKTNLQEMLLAIEHRGPDDTGSFVEGEVGLGNNRLSIIDLTKKGRQPIFNEDNSICIVYNGEIYNFQDIRKQLESKHRFKSKTDTEVILHAYEEWGTNCLQRLNGMFAFVIYDRKKNLLFGARDRVGEKPLKYYWDGEIFAFASEVKGLFPVIPNKTEIDPQAISDFLTLQYVPAPKTGFKNIFKLPPASYFIFKNGKLEITKYWDLNFSEKLELKEEEWKELLFEKINDSVKSRLVSDVPVGAFLSGGIDSSAVVALMAKSTKNKIKTFNIAFDDPEFDESSYAKQVSDLYKTEHTSVLVTQKDMQKSLLNFTNYYDEPFADNSLIPTLLLSQITGSKVKVALSGDGGDENFAGYERYNVVKYSQNYNSVPGAVRNMLKLSAKAAAAVSRQQLLGRARTFSETFDKPFYEKYMHYNSFFDNKTKNEIFSNDFKQKAKEDTFLSFKGFYNNDLSEIDNALNIDINTYLPEDLLQKVDTASMAYSLEVRAPLLNHELLELTAKMPGSLKIKSFDKKYIFKKLLIDKDILPAGIVNRKKKGFVAPIKKWLKGDLKDYVKDQVLSDKIRSSGIFDNPGLEKYLNDYYHSKRDINSNSIFALLTLSSWMSRYL